MRKPYCLRGLRFSIAAAMSQVVAAASDPMFGLFRVLDDEGVADPRFDPGLDDATVTRMYRALRQLYATSRQPRLNCVGCSRRAGIK